MEEKMLAGIGAIAATSLVTLYCNALETLSDHPIISDPKSVEIMTDLNKNPLAFDTAACEGACCRYA